MSKLVAPISKSRDNMLRGSRPLKHNHCSNYHIQSLADTSPRKSSSRMASWFGQVSLLFSSLITKFFFSLFFRGVTNSLLRQQDLRGMISMRDSKISYAFQSLSLSCACNCILYIFYKSSFNVVLEIQTQLTKHSSTNGTSIVNTA